MSNLIDSGWAAWLPFELIDALEARSGRSADRRALRERLERGPSEADEERWERFRLVCPSRIDLPADARGLTAADAETLLDQLGLLDSEPEPVELVLTLDARFGGGKVGRNDPCPCGSGKKYKRCHGS